MRPSRSATKRRPSGAAARSVGMSRPRATTSTRSCTPSAVDSESPLRIVPTDVAGAAVVTRLAVPVVGTLGDTMTSNGTDRLLSRTGPLSTYAARLSVCEPADIFGSGALHSDPAELPVLEHDTPAS